MAEILAEKADLCILISAGAEWRGFLPHFPGRKCGIAPFGDYFQENIEEQQVIFMHGGSGKVAAAGSTQYAIDRWHPRGMINLGTCGGFKGYVEQGEVIFVEKTIIYDILEQMTNANQAIRRYSTDLDTAWLPDPPPQPVQVGTLLSADRDILPADIPTLIEKYHAAAADWESGAIAWVAQKNAVPCLILRAVSDVVDANASPAYGNYAFFEDQCRHIMGNFARYLPAWIKAFQKAVERDKQPL